MRVRDYMKRCVVHRVCYSVEHDMPVNSDNIYFIESIERTVAIIYCISFRSMLPLLLFDHARIASLNRLMTDVVGIHHTRTAIDF